MKHMESANAGDKNMAVIGRAAAMVEDADAQGHYHVMCFDAEGNLKWEDDIKNVVCTEGKNAMLHQALKGSAYTSSLAMGFIQSANYTTPPAAGNTAAGITTASGTPTNGWNEATAAMIAARVVPTLAAPSGGSIALSSTANATAAAACTIKGVFLLMKDVASVAPSTTPGGTAGALWSAGLFSGGDKTLAINDQLQVTYTTSL